MFELIVVRVLSLAVAPGGPLLGGPPMPPTRRFRPPCTPPCRRSCRSRAVVQKLSLMTVALMFALVTATGVRITDGTVVLPFFVCWLIRPAGGCLPWARAPASSAASWASLVTALVDRHVLRPGEDPLDSRQRRVLAGGRDRLRLDAGADHRGDAALGHVVVGSVDRVEAVVAERRDRLLSLVLRVAAEPVRACRTAWRSSRRPCANWASAPCLNSLAFVVGRIAVDHDDRAGRVAGGLERSVERRRLEHADAGVVERDVIVDRRVGDQAGRS